RIAAGVGRRRGEEMRRAGKRRRRVGERVVAVEEEGLDPLGGERRLPLGGADGAGDAPAACGEAPRERQRAVPEAQGEKPGCAAHAALAARVSRVRAAPGWPSRAQSQYAAQITAPAATGARSPKAEEATPVKRAPSAGPPRKIMP